MTKSKKHIIAILLAINVLLSSVGIALHKRACAMPEMGDKISLFVPTSDGCCANKKAEHCHSPQKKKPINPCCDFESKFLQADYETSISSGLNLDFQILFVLNSVFFNFQLIDNQTITVIEKRHYINPSPPLNGREILLQKQSFLI